MLATLDDSIFAALEDAYGPAVDTPARLRAIAGDSLERARAAIEELAAGIFHQGSYYSASAAAVPFLIELAASPIVARADVLLLLAGMCGAAAEPELAYQPYLFQATPGAPTYPEAVSTIAAVRAGRDTYVAALEAEDASARACAAHLLARLGDDSAIAWLEAALARESDPLARITFHFALARWGRRVETRESGLVADVVATLAIATDRPRGLAAIRRLLVLERPLERQHMPAFDGDLVRFAAGSLVEHASDDPHAFEVAEQALHERLARGEAIRELPVIGAARLCDDPDATRSRDFVDYFADVPLRTIAGAMTSLAFGERARDPQLLRREQLDERMRRVLALTCDHAIPVPVAGAPWIEPATMARFLAGGGPLDAEIEWQGETQPLFAILVPLMHRELEDAAPVADQLFAAIVERWTPERATELAIDILDDGYGLMAYYGQLAAPIALAIERHVHPLARRCPALLAAYAERLLARTDHYGAQVEFAFAREIEANEPVEPRFDSLARLAIASRASDRSKVWLASFPEPRRARMVASFGSAYLLEQLGSACDRATLEDAMIEAFLDRGCQWYEHDAESVLARIDDTARLQALLEQATGRRRAVLARVLRTRTRVGVFVLDMHEDGDRIRATLRDGAGRELTQATLSASPRVDELVPLVQRCVGEGELAIELAGDIDSTTNYRVMRLLPEAGFRGRIQSR
ncbi:MAG TPA: hypothetical protein VM869_36560 [Enhygromyxa sp.]|nr:hypothetical protein [Enhygromyxa sp.]